MKIKVVNTETFIQKGLLIHKRYYDYSKVDYINSETKVCIICPEHGEFWQTPVNHISLRQGCPRCNQSHGEKRVEQWLKNNSIEYKTEHPQKINGRLLRFDFYISDYDIYIEYDGVQHFPEHIGQKFFDNKIFTFHRWLRVKEQDDLKNEWCENNNKKLLRINYKQLKSLEMLLCDYFNQYGLIKGEKMKDRQKFIIGENVQWSKCGVAVYLRAAENVVIEPKSFKNIEIMERFNMDGVFGSMFIDKDFHKQNPQCWHSAGLFDDGFGTGIEGGAIGGISLYNMSDEIVTIKKGERICQMVFFESNPAKKYDGFYNQNQTITSQFDSVKI